MERVMQTRTVTILSVTLAVGVFLWAGPLAAQTSPTPSPTCTPNSFTIPEASRGHEVANEVYAPSVTPAIYLVNFIILYMANPDLAAYMPAYKAPIPQPLVDCLEQNPMGCPGLITGNTSMSKLSTTGIVSGRTVVRRSEMGALGATEGHTARTDQRATWEEASRSARSR